MLDALGREEFEIDRTATEHAIELAKYQLSVREQFDPIDANTVVAKMEQRILRALKHGPCDKRTLRNSAHADRDGLYFFQAALTNLLTAGMIRLSSGGKTYELVP